LRSQVDQAAGLRRHPAPGIWCTSAQTQRVGEVEHKVEMLAPQSAQRSLAEIKAPLRDPPRR